MAKKEPEPRQFDARLAAVYTRREDKKQHYDEWAADYDADLVDDLEYVAYRDAGDIFAARMDDRNCRILDVACGTGLAGAYLAELGYRCIDGADFSPGMLALATERGCYNALWQHDFTTPKQLEQPYDALLCVGLFSFALPEISHLHNVVNCVETGGLCIITINGAAWRQLQLEDAVYQAVKQHDFRLEEIIEAGYIQKQGIDSRILVLRR